MRVFLCHNYYRLRGGEDQAFENEAQLLRDHGHEVETYSSTNRSLNEDRPLEAARNTFWNREAYENVREKVRVFRPDVFHCHNFFPHLSPSIFAAAKDEGVPTVQTLHNFRLGCVNGLFFRDGQVCEDCIGLRFGWPGVRHGCYRGSRGASLVTAAMVAYHWRQGSWTRLVDRYICLTSFGKSKFAEIGLPEAKLAVKPNLVTSDPGRGEGNGGYAIWVGRLSPEKGVRVLLDAWRGAAASVPLHVYGEGPMKAELADLASRTPAIRMMGQRPRDEVFAAIRNAHCLVLPSTCYEGFPMALIESMAMGTPAVAAGHGAMAAIIRDGETGILVPPGDGEALGANVAWLAGQPEVRRRLSDGCRAEFESKFTPEANCRRLLEIYEGAKEAASPPS